MIIESIRIVYDEKSDDLKARLKVIYKDMKGTSNAIGIDKVNECLHELSVRKGMTLTELMEAKLVSFDDNVASKYRFNDFEISRKKFDRAERNKNINKDVVFDKEEPEKEVKTIVVEKESDGAVDITSDVKTEKADNSEIRVKNLKIRNWKVLKPVLIAGATIATIAVIASAIKNNDNVYYFDDGVDNNDDYTHANQMDDGSVPTTYNTSSQEEIERVFPVENYEYGILNYSDYDHLYGEDMGNQLDDINAICYENIYDIFQFINGGNLVEPPMLCHLQELVPEEDQAAVRTIAAARNNMVNNAYSMQDRSLTRNDIDNLLAQYINYIYEGGTMFNGEYIKSFDSLSPYAKYVVAVMGQSTLQLRPDYQYTTNYEEYDFDNLVNRYDDIVYYNYGVLTDGYVR